MPYSLTVAPVRRTCPTSADSGLEKAMMSGSVWRFSTPWLEREERFGGGVGVEHAVVVAQHQDGMRQRREQQIVLDMPARAADSTRSRAGSAFMRPPATSRVEVAEAGQHLAGVLGGAQPAAPGFDALAAARPLDARYQPMCLRALRRPCAGPSCSSMASTWAAAMRALLGQRRRARIVAGGQRCGDPRRASTARHRRRARSSPRRRRRLRAPRARWRDRRCRR